MRAPIRRPRIAHIPQPRMLKPGMEAASAAGLTLETVLEADRTSVADLTTETVSETDLVSDRASTLPDCSPDSSAGADGDGFLTGLLTAFPSTVFSSTDFLGLTISTVGLTRAAATAMAMVRLLYGLTIQLTGSVFRIPMDSWRPAIADQTSAGVSTRRACRLQVLRVQVLRVQAGRVQTAGGVSEAAISRHLPRHRLCGGDSSPATGWRRATIAARRQRTDQALRRTTAVIRRTTVATRARRPSG